MSAKIGVFMIVGALLLAGLSSQDFPKPDTDPSQLGPILKAAREYCGKLEGAALDFICLEEVEEKLDLSRDDRKALERAAAIRDPLRPGDVRGLLSRMEIRRNPKQENTYLYDYQFIRREGKIEEKRVLLERNGKKTDISAPDVRMSAFNYSDVLLAPVQLLDQRFEMFYSYQLLGRDVVSGIEAWVLEVAPRVAGDARRYLGGKLWLKTDDASVLKIEWDPRTFGHYEDIQARADAYKATPEVRSYSEFGVEKSGLRFPSADFTEEAYRGANGKLFVRARTNVTYRAHKFFTVETSSTFKK
jgi:hypothetical protein